MEGDEGDAGIRTTAERPTEVVRREGQAVRETRQARKGVRAVQKFLADGVRLV